MMDVSKAITFRFDSDRFTLTPKNWVFLFFLALGFRILYLAWLGANLYDPNGDEFQYINVTSSWLTQGLDWDSFFKLTNGERLPGYFLFIAILGLDIKRIVIFQMIMDSLTCTIFSYTFAHYLKNLRLTLLFSVLLITNPTMIIYSAMILNETLFLFCLSLATFFLCQFHRTQANWACFYCSLFLASLLFIKVGGLVVSIIFAVSIIIITRATALRKFSLLIMLCIPSCLIGMYQVKSIEKLSSSQALTTQAGTHLLKFVLIPYKMANETISREKALAEIDAKLMNHPLFNRTDNEVLRSQIRSSLALEEFKKIPLTLILRESLISVAIMFSLPAAVDDPKFKKIRQLSFSRDTSGSIFNRILQIITGEDKRIVMIGFLFGIGMVFWWLGVLIGVPIALRRCSFVVFLSFILVGCFALISVPLMTPKYRHPAEPFISLFLAWGFYHILNFLDSTKLDGQ